MSSFSFSNTKTSVFSVPSVISDGINALVVSGQDFGRTLPLTRAIPQFMKSLLSVVKRNQINCLFFLGDLVYVDDGSESAVVTATMKTVIAALEELPIPVYIMGGERDRVLLWQMKYTNPGSNVRVVYDYAIKIGVPGASDVKNVFLTYDLMNPVPVRYDQADEFTHALKRAFYMDIQERDYLVVGHPKGYAVNEAKKYASIKNWSVDHHRTGYAIVTREESGLTVKVVGE